MTDTNIEQHKTPDATARSLAHAIVEAWQYFGTIDPAIREEALSAVIATGYDDLVRVAWKVIDYERKQFNRRSRAASVHNNTEGVGIHFDYTDPAPPPTWLAELESTYRNLTSNQNPVTPKDITP